MNITPVVLCGGSGTRLWPLSRQSLPKQFVPLVGDKSLLRLTLERLAWCGEPALCIASEDHRFLVSDDIERASQRGAVVLEPQEGDGAISDRGLLGFALRADGTKQDLLYVDGGVSTNGEIGKLRMQGNQVFRHITHQRN